MKDKQTEKSGFWSHILPVTRSDLKKAIDKVMADLAQVKADLEATKVSLTQVNVDIADTQTQITALKAKIKELEDAAGGSGVPQEIADLVAQVKGLAQAADDALPNPVVIPPTP